MALLQLGSLITAWLGFCGGSCLIEPAAQTEPPLSFCTRRKRAQNPVAAAAAAADDSMQDADPAPRRCSPRIVNQKHLGFIVPPLGQQRYPPMVGTDIAASRTHGGRRSWCTGGP